MNITSLLSFPVCASICPSADEHNKSGLQTNSGECDSIVSRSYSGAAENPYTPYRATNPQTQRRH